MSKQNIAWETRRMRIPKHMSHTLRDYTRFAKKLERVLRELTEKECAKRCRNSKGCCVKDAYGLGATPEMKKYQRAWGHIRNLSSKCQYHHNGCTLRYRPSRCLTTFCKPIREYLESKYRYEGIEFVTLMSRAENVSNSLLTEDKGEALFSAMEMAIEAGERTIKRWGTK